MDICSLFTPNEVTGLKFGKWRNAKTNRKNVKANVTEKKIVIGVLIKESRKKPLKKKRKL